VRLLRRGLLGRQRRGLQRWRMLQALPGGSSAGQCSVRGPAASAHGRAYNVNAQPVGHAADAMPMSIQCQCATGGTCCQCQLYALARPTAHPSAQPRDPTPFPRSRHRHAPPPPLCATTNPCGDYEESQRGNPGSNHWSGSIRHNKHWAVVLATATTRLRYGFVTRMPAQPLRAVATRTWLRSHLSLLRPTPTAARDLPSSPCKRFAPLAASSPGTRQRPPGSAAARTRARPPPAAAPPPCRTAGSPTRACPRRPHTQEVW
jgi:hypothetical protein